MMAPLARSMIGCLTYGTAEAMANMRSKRVLADGANGHAYVESAYWEYESFIRRQLSGVALPALRRSVEKAAATLEWLRFPVERVVLIDFGPDPGKHVEQAGE